MQLSGGPLLCANLPLCFLPCRAPTLASSTPTRCPLLCWWVIRLPAVWTVYSGPPSQWEDWLSFTCPTDTQHLGCSPSVWYEHRFKGQIHPEVNIAVSHHSAMRIVLGGWTLGGRFFPHVSHWAVISSKSNEAQLSYDSSNQIFEQGGNAHDRIRWHRSEED